MTSPLNARIIVGDVRQTISTLPKESMRTCITSPPYWGLRDYEEEKQIGQEDTPEEYVQSLVEVFRGVRDALTKDGTLWLNLGDSYVGTGHKGNSKDPKNPKGRNGQKVALNNKVAGLKPKDMIGIPWRVAFALQADGWYLRSDIIWCLSAGTWLYAKTQKGEAISTIKDLVRLDPSTVKLWNGTKWTQVLGWGLSNDPSERIRLTLRSGERIMSTGNHLWPTKRGNIKAKYLTTSDTIDSTILPESEDAKVPSFMTDDMLWLLGLYMAEGSRSGDVIQLSLHAKEFEWFPRIQKAVEHLGGTITYTINGNRLAVRIYGKVVKALFDTYLGGQTSKNKHFALSVWKFPNAALKEIMNGYFDGDGHYDIPNNRIRIGFTRNLRFEQDIRTMAARLGATLTLNLSTSKIGEVEYPSHRGEWRWECSEHHNAKDRRAIAKIEIIENNYKFWDISVEDKPNLFALASGVLTHNCKPNSMPSPVKDRPVSSYEHIFLLSKSRKYFYDHEAVKEETVDKKGKRTLRDVWNVNIKPYKEAHFAVYPKELILPCVLAGSEIGDTVLDPFSGSGTTGIAALGNERNYIGLEANFEYAELSRKRIGKEVSSSFLLLDDLNI